MLYITKNIAQCILYHDGSQLGSFGAELVS